LVAYEKKSDVDRTDKKIVAVHRKTTVRESQQSSTENGV